MIALEPSARPSFDLCLHSARGLVFPESFYSFLHNYVASVNELPAPSPFVSAAASAPASNISTVTSPHTPAFVSPTAKGSSASTAPPNGTGAAEDANGLLPSDSDHRIERIWADFESLEPYLVLDSPETPAPDANVRIEYTPISGPTRAFQVCRACTIVLASTYTPFRTCFQ
jgi:phosphoinositide-3-kinase regulatory subunit 4